MPSSISLLFFFFLFGQSKTTNSSCLINDIGRPEGLYAERYSKEELIFHFPSKSRET